MAVAGCEAASGAVDDAATVTVGAGVLDPIDIQRDVSIGIERVPACVEISIGLPDSNTSLRLEETELGCALTLVEPDVVLFDQQDAEQARRAIGPFEVDGIRSGSVELRSLVATGEEGEPLELERLLNAVSLKLDGEPVLTDVAPAELVGDVQPSRQIPEPVLDELRAAVRNDEPVTVDVALTLVVADSALSDLPSAIALRARLQPRLEVDVIEAAL